MGTQVNFELAPDSAVVYSNFAAVQFTPTDIIIRFCLVDPLGKGIEKDDESQEITSVNVPVSVSVFLNPETAEGLIVALTKQFDEWSSRKSEEGKSCPT